MAISDQIGKFSAGDMLAGTMSKLGTVAQIGMFALVAGAVGFFFLMLAKYKTKVILIKQRSGGSEYKFSRAKMNLVKNVYTVKTDGLFGKTKNIPLPDNDSLIAKNGKSDIIVLRVLPNGELRYCTHPDVKHVTFKTLSADYRQFDLIDAEETKKRHGSGDWWKEHGGTVMMLGFIVLIFVLMIILMDKFDQIGGSLGAIAANIGELSKQTVT